MPLGRQLFLISAVILWGAFNGCGDDAGKNPGQVKIVVDFDSRSAEWQGGYSDYSPATEPTDVVWETRPLPQPFAGNGLYTFGTNKSDDLFIYIKAKFSGFAPQTQYALRFQVQFVTNAPSGCAGAGGSPGEGVSVIGGASPSEPLTVLVGGEYQMNMDKGNQSVGGKDALMLGNIANSNTDCSNPRYESKTLTSASPLTAVSDSSGDMWLLWGIDSGFEGASHIYYQSITVTASPV